MFSLPELLTVQHAQISDLFALVVTLRDPDALDELADTVSYHLCLESELLYPKLSLSPEIVDELAAEHREIRRVLTELLWFGEADDDFGWRLEQLGTLLEGHVAYQEEELFERAAGVMSDSQLADLGSRLGARAPFMYERAQALASSAA